MSLRPFFGPSDVEHRGGICAASGRRKSEELPLLLPIVRQIPGKHYKPCRCQLDRLLNIPRLPTVILKNDDGTRGFMRSSYSARGTAPAW